MLTAIHKQAMAEAANRLEAANLVQAMPSTPEDIQAEQDGAEARQMAIAVGLGLANNLASDLFEWWRVPDSKLSEVVEVIDPVLQKYDVSAPDWLVVYKEEIRLARVLGLIGIEQYQNYQQFQHDIRASKAKDVTPKKEEGATNGSE